MWRYIMKKRILSFLLVLVMFFSIFVPISSTKVKAESNTIRYTVLVLDTSGSVSFSSGGTRIYTADTAIDYVKQAASVFLDDILEADGVNYVSIVSFKSSATVVSDFSNDTTSLPASGIPSNVLNKPKVYNVACFFNKSATEIALFA